MENGRKVDETELRGKRIVVVGLGASGVSAARLCLRRGAGSVVATDAKARNELSASARALEAEGASLIAGGRTEGIFANADIIVVSPGVPGFPELARAERAGIPIWGEVELAVRSLPRPAPLLAIGGTNGKSTTTSLVGALLEAGGLRTFVGGNLGEPLSDHVDEAWDAIVLEVSSFQMERVDRFRPNVSVLLNISPDHLDRYPSAEAYANAKGNAFVRQTGDDVAVIPVGDQACHAQASRGGARIVTFGPGGDFDVRADGIQDRKSGEVYARTAIALTGGHNALNVAASLAAVREFRLAASSTRDVLHRFKGLPHRTALVRELRGVRYYDDSKGTNVGATVTAVVGLLEPKAVLIAGGRDKGGSYEPLAQALSSKGRAAVLIGEAAEAIAQAIGAVVPVRHAQTMDDAVRIAADLAEPGDAVLLSPACSSFDMFRDYKHRGDEFVRAVEALGQNLDQRGDA